jgi:DNA-binding NarL/FixJ family response regulator
MLVEAIKTVFNNGVFYSPAIRQKLQKLTDENRFDPVLVKRKSSLTRRETEILILICKGKTTKEIAALLDISERTIGHFRVNLMAKTGSAHVADLVAYAVRHGLIQID